MDKPYYLLVEVQEDFGVPVDIEEMVEDFDKLRALRVRIVKLRSSVAETVKDEIDAVQAEDGS